MRRPDWQKRLGDILRAHRAAQFSWGENDCCLFAAEVVEALTGLDPTDGLRGHYSSAEEARAILEHFGVTAIEDLAATVAERLGFEEVKPLFAQRGDVVYSEQRLIGVCIGSACAFVGAEGLVYLPVESIERAWRVH